MRSAQARQYAAIRNSLRRRDDGKRRPRGFYEFESWRGKTRRSEIFHLPHREHEATLWVLLAKRTGGRVTLERIPDDEVSRRVICRHLTDEEYEERVARPRREGTGIWKLKPVPIEEWLADPDNQATEFGQMVLSVAAGKGLLEVEAVSLDA